MVVNGYWNIVVSLSLHFVIYNFIVLLLLLLSHLRRLSLDFHLVAGYLDAVVHYVNPSSESLLNAAIAIGFTLD